ncbi:putative ribonuclease H-like domain-containing protein [Tanacetum coccineum]
MLELEDYSIFEDDEDVGAEADMHNFDTTIQKEPKKVIHALKDPCWIEAMREELLQFKLQEVWTLVDLPNGKKAIGTKWVLKNKKDERRIMIRNKARLVTQGYTQEEGIDYDEVFSLVARIEVIRLFLPYASFKDFVVYQMDVKIVFLYGKIKEDVYVGQPLGFEDPDFSDRVYKVEKALYGLHQASRAWYETLSTYLLDNEFQRGKIDKILFIKRHKGDILLMSSMGELIFFLGLHVQQKKDGIFISQDKYVDEILKKFRFTEVKTASTLMKTQNPLLKDKDGKEVDVHMYRSMIGSLMYLTSSRPDSMFAVYACARYQVNPKISHLHAVKRIFRYLKGQPKLDLWYPKDSLFDLVAYTDSDYNGASLDRKSTTGGCQFLRCRLISWQCKKQTVVVNSITEAEYVAASSCFGQVLWIQNQLLEYMYNFMHTMIFIDNNRKAKKSVRLMMEKLCKNRQSDLATVKAKTINWEVQLQALVDGNKIIITESTVRRDLQLEDGEGVDCVPNSTIFKQLALMGIYVTPSHTKKIFGNIRRVGKGFFGRETPLFPTMVVHNKKEMGEGSAIPTDPHHTPTFIQPYPQPQKTQKPRRPKKKDTQVPHSSVPSDNVTDKAVYKELDDSLVRAATTASRSRVGQWVGINAIDADEDITLVNDQDDADMFDVNTLTGDEVFVEQEVAAKDVNLTVDKVTLAQALAALKSVKPKWAHKMRLLDWSLGGRGIGWMGGLGRIGGLVQVARGVCACVVRKGIVITELGTSTTTITISLQPSQEKVKDKGKGILVKEPVKPKKKDLIRLDEEIASKLQAEFDEEERLAREKDEANVFLTEEWDDIHAKVDADY